MDFWSTIMSLDVPEGSYSTREQTNLDDRSIADIFSSGYHAPEESLKDRLAFHAYRKGLSDTDVAVLLWLVRGAGPLQPWELRGCVDDVPPSRPCYFSVKADWIKLCLKFNWFFGDTEVGVVPPTGVETMYIDLDQMDAFAVNKFNEQKTGLGVIRGCRHLQPQVDGLTVEVYQMQGIQKFITTVSLSSRGVVDDVKSMGYFSFVGDSEIAITPEYQVGRIPNPYLLVDTLDDTFWDAATHGVSVSVDGVDYRVNTSALVNLRARVRNGWIELVTRSGRIHGTIEVPETFQVDNSVYEVDIDTLPPSIVRHRPSASPDVDVKVFGVQKSAKISELREKIGDQVKIGISGKELPAFELPFSNCPTKFEFDPYDADFVSTKIGIRMVVASSEFIAWVVGTGFNLTTNNLAAVARMCGFIQSGVKMCRVGVPAKFSRIFSSSERVWVTCDGIDAEMMRGCIPFGRKKYWKMKTVISAIQCCDQFLVTRPAGAKKWDVSVSGAVAYGESPNVALLREIREEIGWNMILRDGPQLFLDGDGVCGVISPIDCGDPDYWADVVGYIIRVDERHKIDSPEKRETKWVDRKELLILDLRHDHVIFRNGILGSYTNACQEISDGEGGGEIRV